jgi:hypothetical protein
MVDESDPGRDAIHETIQASAPLGSEALLTGWAMVAEWVDGSGARWLTKAHSAGIPDWTASGMHHTALHGTWPALPEPPPGQSPGQPPGQS